MTTTCRLCGAQLSGDARVVGIRLKGLAELPALEERTLRDGDGDALAYLCAEHGDAVRLLRSICGDPDDYEERVRSRLYQELDVLAFALEMEASEAVADDRDDAAARAQQTRLGIRLAQRLVGGVPAPEVDERLARWRETYESRFPT